MHAHTSQVPSHAFKQPEISATAYSNAMHFPSIHTYTYIYIYIHTYIYSHTHTHGRRSSHSSFEPLQLCTTARSQTDSTRSPNKSNSPDARNRNSAHGSQSPGMLGDKSPYSSRSPNASNSNSVRASQSASVFGGNRDPFFETFHPEVARSLDERYRNQRATSYSSISSEAYTLSLYINMYIHACIHT